MLIAALLSACGPGADSPEGVASRYMKAQAQGKLDDQLALVTEADRAAASQPPNDKALTPGPDEAPFLKSVAKRIKIGKATAQVDGETAEVTVAGQALEVDLGELMLTAMFSGKDEEAAKRQVLAAVTKAPLKASSETLTLVQENKKWRVDTEWAERAQEETEKKLKADYENREDFTRSLTAARKLAELHPNDAGWLEGVGNYETVVAMLDDFKVDIQSAGIYEADFQIAAEVHKGTDYPLRTVTLRYTFLNGDQPVGEPVYRRFSSMTFFRSRILDAGGSNSAETTGTPPEGWTGESVQAEVTAFSIDGS